MYRKLISFLTISLTICKLVDAQQPLSKSEIIPKLDSIQVLSDLLYNRLNFKIECDKKLAISFKNYKTPNQYLVYEFNDTLRYIQMGKNRVEFEVKTSLKDSSTSEMINKSRKPLPLEDSLFQLKYLLIDTSLFNDHATSSAFVYEQFLVPNQAGFNLYLLSMTNENNLFPLHTSYTYKINRALDYYSIDTLQHKISSMPISIKTEQIFLVYQDNQDFISEIDICKFKFYGKMYKIDELTIFSSKNKRMFFYNRVTNSITISP